MNGKRVSMNCTLLMRFDLNDNDDNDDEDDDDNVFLYSVVGFGYKSFLFSSEEIRKLYPPKQCVRKIFNNHK